MVGTKIFVLQMKDLLRMAVFAVLGLVLIVLLVVLFIPKGKETPGGPSTRYIPGTYTSSIILNSQPVEVTVTVTDRDITQVEMTDMDYTQRVFYPLFEPTMADLAAEVLRSQTAEVEVVAQADYPVTTGILQRAITTALNKAATEE